jgi:diaminopimelate decarboxylase
MISACCPGYTVRAIRRLGGRLEPATVVGRHCEAGDVLGVDVPLPACPSLAILAMKAQPAASMSR